MGRGIGWWDLFGAAAVLPAAGCVALRLISLAPSSGQSRFAQHLARTLDGLPPCPRQSATRVSGKSASTRSPNTFRPTASGHDELLFATSAGTPISHNTLRTRIWLPAVKASNVDFPVRVHDLRHAQIQHPGDGKPSQWPHLDGLTTPHKQPVVVTKDDGEIIGS